MLDGEALVQAISVRGYRPTALREARRICAEPTLFESWVLTVSAFQLRRLRDDKLLDRTDVPQRTPQSKNEGPTK